jgi:hypothetical protein
LQRRTQLPRELVQQILHFLLEHELIKKAGEHYLYNSNSTHIPRNSPILPIFHNQWRQRAINDSAMDNAQHVHFTNVQSISLKDYELLQQMTLDFIKASSRLAKESSSEEVFVLTCDLFKA